MYDVHKHRLSGRSTRMLQEAIRLSNEGRAMYVMAANRYHADILQLMLDGLNPPMHHGIKIEWPESLPKFSWQTMTLIGAWPNVGVLVDHWAIESRYSQMLNMLHAFDAAEKEEKDEQRD